MKLMKCLVILALALTVTSIVYAETQSVKVSGDIAVNSFARNNFDLSTGDDSASSDWQEFIETTTEVQVDADLTDNVAGVIRLVNQRAWGNDDYSGVGERSVTGSSNQAFDVGVDLAYIELKEFLYSPLTLRIGRQDLSFGREFIIGKNYQDPQGVLLAPEYSAITSFDAIRATLDYDPWTIDGVFAKAAENVARSDDDVNLYGVNVGYLFDDYNAEAEAYWWYNQDRQVWGTISGLVNADRSDVISNDIHVFGMRGSFDPIEDWTIALEGAYQFGDYKITNQATERDRNAWAIDAYAECRYFQDQFAWRPVVSLEYIYYSGEKDQLDEGTTSTGDFEGWDPMYRGKVDTAIRDFQNVYYTTQSASTAANTNQHQIIVEGIVEPTDSLTCSAKYAHFWLDEKVSASNTKKNIGDEVDLECTWDYTEDVQFGLLAAWFIPGSHFEDNQDSVATDIVGTVKLSF